MVRKEARKVRLRLATSLSTLIGMVLGALSTVAVFRRLLRTGDALGRLRKTGGL